MTCPSSTSVTTSVASSGTDINGVHEEQPSVLSKIYGFFFGTSVTHEKSEPSQRSMLNPFTWKWPSFSFGNQSNKKKDNSMPEINVKVSDATTTSPEIHQQDDLLLVSTDNTSENNENHLEPQNLSRKYPELTPHEIPKIPDDVSSDQLQESSETIENLVRILQRPSGEVEAEAQNTALAFKKTIKNEQVTYNDKHPITKGIELALKTAKIVAQEAAQRGATILEEQETKELIAKPIRETKADQEQLTIENNVRSQAAVKATHPQLEDLYYGTIAKITGPWDSEQKKKLLALKEKIVDKNQTVNLLKPKTSIELQQTKSALAELLEKMKELKPSDNFSHLEKELSEIPDIKSPIS